MDTIKSCESYKICRVKHEALDKVVDLKIKSIDVRLEGMEKAIELRKEIVTNRFYAMDDALLLRTGELEKRLEGLNELRSEVISDRDQLVKKETYNIKTAAYDEWCTDINRRISVIETKMSVALENITQTESRIRVWTMIVAIVFTAVQMLLHVLKLI